MTDVEGLYKSQENNGYSARGTLFYCDKVIGHCLNCDNLVLLTELTRLTGYRKENQRLAFRALSVNRYYVSTSSELSHVTGRQLVGDGQILCDQRYSHLCSTKFLTDACHPHIIHQL